MKYDLQCMVEYMKEVSKDPFPRYILKKDILKEIPTPSDIDEIHGSKWYRQLVDEQWEDGSWGRFHSMDSSIAAKQKFVTTEGALRRAYELGLTKDDPVVCKCIKYMERCITGEETWRDHIEKHHDNGRGHMFCRPYMTAANLNLFDPDHEMIKPFRNNVVETFRSAFISGAFDELYWDQKVSEYHVPSVAHPGNAYSIMLLQKSDCMEDELQRQVLSYIWNNKAGIYYICDFAPSFKYSAEDKKFTVWLSSLELLSDFSLFSERMREDVYTHLYQEGICMISNDVKLPPAHPITGHYAEGWKEKGVRKNDLILRILRILRKC